jgi:hypothetical protein
LIFEPNKPVIYGAADDSNPRPESSPDDSFVYVQVETYGGPTKFPRGAAARIQAMSPTEFAAWQHERFLARTNQIWLAQNVLGLDLQENPHAAFAARMVAKQPGVDISQLEGPHGKRKIMMLWSRNIGKTFSVRTEIVQWLLNYPNVRICFLTGGEAIALPQLRALRQHFSTPSKKLREIFPEYCIKSKWNKKDKTWSDIVVPESDWGTMHAFNVPCRTDFSLPESNFTLATEESNSTGAHYDLIFCDDLQNAQNFRTVQAREKTYQSYLGVTPLLAARGFLIVTGTRYHVDDVYAKIMAANAADTRWLFSIRGAYSEDCKTCGRAEAFHDTSVNKLQPPGLPGYPCAGFVPDGIERCLCPTITCSNGTQFGHSLEYLMNAKLEDEPFFWCQYMNAPQQIAGEQTFADSLIGAQTFHDLDWLAQHAPRWSSRVFAAVDLAYTTGLRSDNSVVYIFSVYQGQIFVWWCIYGKWNASTRIMTLTDTLVDSRFRPITTMYIEDNLNSDSTKLLLESAAKDKGISNLPVQFLAPNRQKDAKLIRIGDIEQILKAKRLWLFAGMPGYDILVKQLLAHPNQSQGHDDFSDCLGIVCQCPTNYLGETAPQTPRPQGGPSWLEKLSLPQEPESTGANDGSGFAF